ncbi:IclR family transcriptional regulator [Oceanobacillus senegalensis]|uniref:IclR family transcriptional regulator n=1 Tax=Oceanobacillus senegalensis TaxID=1936063 RepID=UPI000A309F4B|nr:IclR family transcriptional regulator [Oceanobacillus senegalensis]
MKQGVISKTFKILRSFTDKKNEWGVNELSRYLDMPVSTVHRILSTLKNEHIVEYSELTGKYKLGPEMIRMASIISAKVDIKRIAYSHLFELSIDLDHSVYFAQYYSHYRKLAFVDCVKSKNALQYVLEIGVLQPIHVAASGKNILAYLEESEINEILEGEVELESDRNKVRDELKQIKNQGYAITSNERKMGALSVGAPVFDVSGEIIGSVICVFPISDYEKEKESKYIQRVKKAAKDISHSMGYVKN